MTRVIVLLALTVVMEVRGQPISAKRLVAETAVNRATACQAATGWPMEACLEYALMQPGAFMVWDGKRLGTLRCMASSDFVGCMDPLKIMGSVYDNGYRPATMDDWLALLDIAKESLTPSQTNVFYFDACNYWGDVHPPYAGELITVQGDMCFWGKK